MDKTPTVRQLCRPAHTHPHDAAAPPKATPRTLHLHGVLPLLSAVPTNPETRSQTDMALALARHIAASQLDAEK